MPSALPLLLTALLIATSGLVYELLAAAVASWVLGDSVTQFSIVIGLYLSALGLGSWLSGRVRTRLATAFVITEIGVALVGGLMVPVLFSLFADTTPFRLALYGSVLACGALVGLEIPLLVRILREREHLPSAIARVLAFDHAGSLVGALLFSLWLMPRFGPLPTGLTFGVINAGVAFASTIVLGAAIEKPWRLRLASAAAACVLLAMFTQVSRLVHHVDRDERPSTTRATHVHAPHDRSGEQVVR